jgi:transcriptional regulator with XRE-family HTH domain
VHADPPPPHVLARRVEIGTRIRNGRLDANLSQEQLAEAARIDRRTISAVELGTTSARLDWLLLIADALGVELADLVR